MFQIPAANMLLVVFAFILYAAAGGPSVFVVAAARPINTGELIRAVCIRTQNPGFCFPVFTRDPRSETARDFTVLAQIAVDATSPNVSAVYNKLQILAKQNKDPALKQGLERCIGLYGAANVDISQATGVLKSKNYGLFSSIATAIDHGAKDCNSALKPSPIEAESRFVEDYADIMEVVASLLLT